MDTMTETTLTLRPHHLVPRLWHRLTTNSLRRTTVARLEELSDRQLRDIGIERDQIEDFSIKTAHDAMCYSG
jgi:uncharacterized protein YjiS (DUF1127 family)